MFIVLNAPAIALRSIPTTLDTVSYKPLVRNTLGYLATSPYANFNNIVTGINVINSTLDRGKRTLILTQTNGRTLTATWIDSVLIEGGGGSSAVSSVYGRTGAVVAASGDYTTSQVTEAANLYYTDAKARAAITLSQNPGGTTYTPATGVLNISPSAGGGLATNGLSKSGDTLILGGLIEIKNGIKNFTCHQLINFLFSKKFTGIVLL